MKRAVIYIRVSSEHQGAKASPEEQEQDCRQLADEQGLEVVAIYRDVEKYRAKKKLVEPSGTRSDRPGLVAMLEAAANGEFGVILAWREDRLYRGMRAMLLVLETIQEHKISILLAKENFDEKMAPLKAWLAQMELDGMKERMTMGVKARLRAGKANCGQDRYGYRREGENIVIVEEEAYWVRKIFDWYLQGVNRVEIRRRLIEAGAPQKGGSIPRKMEWSTPVIDGVFKGAETYCLGIKKQSRKGEVFEIPVPPILDPEIYPVFLEIREANKKNRRHNQKHHYLLAGLLTCACERKWIARLTGPRRRDRRGNFIERKSRYWIYYCTQIHEEKIHPDCPRTFGARKADTIVWGKVREAISNPDILLGKARLHVEELRAQAGTLDEERQRLQNQLDSLVMERQQIITWGRKRMITEEDMEYQLGALTLQELALKRELAALADVTNLEGLQDWEPVLQEYFLDLQAGIDSLDRQPENEEEAEEIFRLKLGIVRGLVNRVVIDKDRNLQVEIQVDVLSILREAAKPSVDALPGAGTYTHIR